MKISFKQFLDPSIHSWATVGTSLARCFKKLGHQVDMCSTNGYKGFPSDLEENIKCKNCTDDKTRNPANCKLDKDYDLSISYTMMMNFPHYLSYSGKNRFGIYNIDSTELPRGFAKYYKYATKLLPSSQLSYDVFKKSGIPESIMKVVPHGYNPEFIERKDIYKLNTDRKRKILVNIQQNHMRKNFPGILESWGKAFTDKDDVVLVAKLKRKIDKKTDISWLDEYTKMKKRFKNHAPILIVDQYIPMISDLYRACDIVFSASHMEMFNLPMLEGMAAGKLVIGSNFGGNVDFMNNDNSLLIDGIIDRAPKEMFYWEFNVLGSCYYPSSDHAAEQLRRAAFEHESLMQKFSPGIEKIKQDYTWENVGNKMIELI